MSVDVARCRWCGDATTHDDVWCLREERDVLKTYFREAVDALSPYLQSGGRYAFLMQLGQSITTVGPKLLVDYLEAQIADCRLALAARGKSRGGHVSATRTLLKWANFVMALGRAIARAVKAALA